MPSPRTVLADIADRDLDPKVSHHALGRDGHLKRPLVEVIKKTIVESKVEKTTEPVVDRDIETKKVVFEPELHDQSVDIVSTVNEKKEAKPIKSKVKSEPKKQAKVDD